MKKIILILTALLSIIITSFAQVKLFDTEITREERTLKITSNINDVKVRFSKAGEDYRQDLGTISNGNLSYIFSSIAAKQTTLEFYGDHVETKTVKLLRYLKNFTNPFSPNSYALAFKSRSLSVDMNFKDSYMETKFKEIENSQDPKVFEVYNSAYPKSKQKQIAINKKDSLELNIAVNKRSEKAMDEYISANGSSKFLAEAQKIKKDYAEARVAFENAKRTDNVAGYETFITQYTKSIEYNDAHVLLINAAEKQALSLNNSDASLKYFDNYLVKFSSFLKKEDFETKKNTITSAIDQQIVSENVDEKNKYNSYSKLWKRYQDILSSKAENLGYFEKAESYREKISNELFNALTKLNTEAAQTNFLKKAEIDFPKLESIEDPNTTFLYTILGSSQGLNGILKLYNQNHIPNFVKNNCGERCPLVGKSSYEYKGNYLEAFVGPNYEEITFRNGYFSDIKVFKDKQLLTHFKFTDSYVSEANFYQNGKLARTDYVEPNWNYYSYEYENGVNISLKSLDTKISEADKALAANDFDRAINILNNDCQNKFPKNTAQNQRIQNTITKVNQSKEAYLKKQEEIRLAEEKKREDARLVEEKKQEVLRLAEEKKQEALRLAEAKKQKNSAIPDIFGKSDERTKEEKLKSQYSENICIRYEFICQEEEKLSLSKGRYDYILFLENGTLKLGNCNYRGDDVKINGYGSYTIYNNRINVKDNYGDEYYFKIEKTIFDPDNKCTLVALIKKQDMINYKGNNMGGQIYKSPKIGGF